MKTSVAVRRAGMVRHLTQPQFDQLSGICSEIREVEARATIAREHVDQERSLLLLDGMIGRYVTDVHGERRRLVALQVPGDFVDLHSFPLTRLDHEVITMTDVQIAVVPHAAIRQAISHSPDLGRTLWALTMIDASIHRHWAYRVSAMRAMERLANFLSEIAVRLEQTERLTATGYDLPLTQPDMGEACGMTAVHVNRSLRDLREDGCCTIQSGHVHIHDRARLEKVGGFDPFYLYLPQDPAVPEGAEAP